MGRSPSCERVGLRKGLWTPEEDKKLLDFIEQHGHGSWRALPLKAGLQRCGKSCRLRWTNYLKPDIKRGQFSLQEEQTIIQLHALLGNRWSAIATHLPQRTDNEIKNHWNTHLKKRLTKLGIDPVTHKPGSGCPYATTGLSHMAQWESARLEAETRLVRESRLLSSAASRNTNNPLPVAVRPPCLDVLKAWQAQLGEISPSSSCSSALSAIMALSTDHLESPTSTLMSFPAGMSCTVENTTMVFPGSKEANDITILPLSGSQSWFGPGARGTEDNVEGFPEFPVDEYEDLKLAAVNSTCNSVGENYVTAGEHNNVTGITAADDNRNYWNNILMNLVTVNASALR